MKKSLIIIILLFLLSSAWAQDIRIACIGNSITAGRYDSYPAYLDSLLGEGYNVQNFGVVACTMLKNGDYPFWNEPKFSQVLEFQPNIVTIMLGTNDSKPLNWEYKDEFISDYISMIDTLRSLESNPNVYVCLPPPAFSIQWGINDSIITADIIPMIKQIAEEKNTPLIDFYTPFVDKNDLFPDDIHPNSEGLLEFAKIIENILLKTALAVEGSSLDTPAVIEIFRNYPNPFNPSTTIKFAIYEDESFHVKLNVYDLRGALVRTLVNQVINPGIHSIVWDGIDKTGNKVSSGVYIYWIQAGRFSKTNRMLLIR